MADFKVTVKINKSLLKKQTIQKIRDVIKDDRLGQHLGEFLASRVRFEAKRRKPLNDSGSFPPIQESTKESREYLEQFNDTTDAYSKGRSNLSFTGQLLDSITFKKISDASKGIVEIFFSGERKAYRTRNGVLKLKKISRRNSSLAAALAKKGFVPFTARGIEKNKAAMTRLTNIVRNFIRKNLR